MKIFFGIQEHLKKILIKWFCITKKTQIISYVIDIIIISNV